jgi:outer membrane protein assembly factor BamB
MKEKILYLSRVALFLCFIAGPVLMAQTNDWTHFRGSHLDGISLDQHTPTVWSESTHVAWKTEIKGRGWSSPVVLGDQIWLTTAALDGKEMFGIGVDFKSGKILFDLPLFKQDKGLRKHSVNSYATPTPCIEEGYVYMHFGSSGTACVNTKDGSIVWSRQDLVCDHVQGPGSSPILYKQFLILHYEGSDRQFIVALDKKTGKTIWEAERPKELYDRLQPIGKKAYTTPIVITAGDRDVLISNGSAVCIAYDVMTGKEVWRVVQGEDSTIAMPLAEHGVLYFYTSFVAPPGGEKYAELLAVDPTGTGDVTNSHVKWRARTPILQLLTPLIKDGIIYTVDTKNVLLVLDARDGALLYSKKLEEKYNSSPVYAAGRIYLTSVKGKTLILKAGKSLEIVAENSLPGEVFATPALVRNSIVFRNASSLYRISGQ